MLCGCRFRILGGIFDPAGLKADIERLSAESGQAGFWADRGRAERDMAQLKRLRRRYLPWQKIVSKMDELAELHALALAEGEDSLMTEIESGVAEVTGSYGRLRMLELLNGAFDAASCFLEIHAGAGGTEACDWVAMLLRMYSRWVDKHQFRMSIIDMQEAEGGVKSVTLQVDGEWVYGYLKCEAGVHRLVRISPFDSGKRRHTSFASVYASPIIEDDIELDVRPEDLRVDTYRSSGAGGQHVNKTDSAVRITHLKTNIVVQCQNERSQHKNRATAMKVLLSRLYEHYRSERERERQETAIEKRDIAWGSQIRSYIFQPYQMVKDHRTGCESGNVTAVMDGELDAFIDHCLRWNWTGQQQADSGR